MKRSEIKDILAGGVVKFMRTQRTGYEFARRRVESLAAKHPDLLKEIEQDAVLARLVRFERRHPKAFAAARESTVHRAAVDAKVSSGALYVEFKRLERYAADMGTSTARAIRQIERIAAEQGPLAPARSGRPRKA